jgi:pimeloyl-ACP methyl ester carboxylesterase
LITTVIAPGGRRLAVETWGAPHGAPVFMLHGTPGSRRTPHPKHSVLYRQGIRLISYDRPGYGDSDPLPGRDVAHAAADVAAIADALGIGVFAVFGRSGGAPHTLACAALLPFRVTRAAALVPLAPYSAEGLDWYGGMTRSNVAAYRCAAANHRALAARLEARAARIRDDPMSQMPFNSTELHQADRRVVADHAIRSMLVDSFVDAVKTSSVGWIDDSMAFTAPWGFDLDQITCPVLLWHGDLDPFSPVDHSRWLAQHIRGAKLVIEKGAGHFGALAALPDVLGWLAGHDGGSRGSAR